MKTKVYYLVGSFLSFLGFLAVSWMVKKNTLDQFDFNTTVKLQDKIPTKLDGFFSALSLIGSFEVLFVVICILLIFRRKIIGGIIAIAALGGAHIIEIIGKTFFHHPGPPHMFLRYDIPWSFPSSYVQPGSSYPSGHSLRIVFVGVLLAFVIWKMKKVPLPAKLGVYAFSVLFIFLMVLSRVTLGEHWTTDVIGGSFLGLSTILFSLVFL